jgi:hypothetical protein
MPGLSKDRFIAGARVLQEKQAQHGEVSDG